MTDACWITVLVALVSLALTSLGHRRMVTALRAQLARERAYRTVSQHHYDELLESALRLARIVDRVHAQRWSAPERKDHGPS